MHYPHSTLCVLNEKLKTLDIKSYMLILVTVIVFLLILFSVVLCILEIISSFVLFIPSLYYVFLFSVRSIASCILFKLGLLSIICFRLFESRKVSFIQLWQIVLVGTLV